MMNLNLKAATTVATIAISALISGSSSVVFAAEWHPSPGSSVTQQPEPVVAAEAALDADRPGDLVSPPLVPAVPISDDSKVLAPISSNPFDSTAGTPNSAAPKSTISKVQGPLANSPFVHSDPRAVAPFPLLLNSAVQTYVKNFLDQPQGLKLAFERSRPFLPEMIKTMKEQGIPDDLVYLSFAESDFSKRGKGPWQFTAGTAARYGLHVNIWIDERRDPILSTKAAAEYLAELHDQADNDWRVALVAWNTGAGNLERYWSLQGTNYNKFADLLPRRTRQLLNRFMAVAFIAHNAPAYGIGDISYANQPVWSTHIFKGGTLLKSIAAQFETTVSKLRELNPALRADRVPPYERAYGIRIPTDVEASN
jgi:membrane-bound lytic murein transglycosylase D